MNKKELAEFSCPFFGQGEEINDFGHCWNKNGEPCIQKCNGLLADGKTPCAYKAGIEWQSKQSPWKKAKDELPFVDEDDISEQSEPVLVIASAKGHYEPEILVYNKHYHVWDTADADDYCCDVSDNDLWMPIPSLTNK
jgi:hypothetical protein